MRAPLVIVGALGAALTVAAVAASAASGSWLILATWLVVAILIALVFALPGPSAGSFSDGRGGLVICPNCGGTAFSAVRSPTGLTTGFLFFGWLGALLAPKSQVRCTACGSTYPRDAVG